MSAANFPVRKNLVVVRAGKGSLHPQWLRDGESRNWDLIVSCYDPSVRFDHDDGVMTVVRPGGKWDGIYAVLSQPGLLDRYEHVWLPDDDIAASSGQIDAVFNAMRRYDLDVAQPALTHDSYFSHFAFLACPGFTLRYTNFVEIMAPCLKTSLLRSVLEDFRASMSGFGMDYIWCRLREDGRYRAAILDSIAVRHTRPIGHALRRAMAKSGASAEDEEAALRRRYGVTKRIRPLIYASVDRNGRRREGCAQHGVSMAIGYARVASRINAQEAAGWKILQLLRRQFTRRPDLSQLKRRVDIDPALR